MKSTDTQRRTVLAGQVVSVAGTLLIAAPAFAGHNHDGQSMRQLRHNNPGLSGHALRDLVRDNHGRGRNNGPNIEYQPNMVNQNTIIPVGVSTAPRFDGQSTFLNDRGRTKALSRGLELDLTSGDRSIVLGDNLFANSSSYTVNVGGETKTLTSGSHVSAAEFVALQQVIDGGSQSLTVDKSGRGVDGQFTLNSIDDAGRNIHAKSLVVPVSVDALGDFSRSSSFRLTGDLVNNGNVYASANNSGAANIAARDITNNANASINSTTDLNLAADRDLSNFGSISSTGSVSLSAGRTLTNTGSVSAQSNVNLQSSQVINSGSIASGAGDVNFTTASAADIVVDNTGGTISALNGSINFRTPDFTEKYDTTLTAGDWLSQTLNVNGGDGHTSVDVGALTGVANVHAGTAVVKSGIGGLTIGELVTTGDPLVENATVLNIGNFSTGGGNLSIISGGDINITSGATIDTSNTGGAGGDILMVAGAQYSIDGGGNLTLTGASATGGDISYAGTAPIITSGSTVNNAGDVTIGAFSIAGPTKGNVSLASSTIIANGATGFNNGNVFVIGGGSVQVGSITTKGAGSTATGNILLQGNQPQVSGPFVIDSAGNVTSGGLTPSPTPTTSVFSNGNLLAGGAVTVSGTSTTVAGSITASSYDLTSANNIQIDNPIDISGSLTITTTGQIDVRNNLTARAGMLLVAGTNVVTNGPVTLSTASITGDAGNMTIVAGAGYSQNSSTVTVTGNGGASGRIDIAFPATNVDTRSGGGNGKGGNLTMVAFQNGGLQGTIGLGSTVDVHSGGNGSGASGNIVMVADGLAGITFNKVVSTVGGAAGTGDITMSTTTMPVTPVVLSKTNGGIATGTFLGGAVVNGNVLAGNLGTATLQTNGGDITLIGGRTGSQAIDIQNSPLSAGNGAVLLDAPNGDMRLGSITAGNVVATATGNIDFRNQINTIGSTSGAGVLIVAGGNVSNVVAGDSISTNVGAGGTSGSVSLIAGATYTQDGTTVTITGASAGGGNVDLGNNFDFISTSAAVDGSGGNVNFIAYAGTFGGGVNLGDQINIETWGLQGANTNGNVVMVAGTNSGNAIRTGGPIDTVAAGPGGLSGSGFIQLVATQPTNGVVLSKSTANVTSGSFIPASPVLSTGNIIGANGTSTYHNSGAFFDVRTGGIIDMTGTSADVGFARLSAGNFIQGVGTITANSIAITSANSIALRGNLTSTGGAAAGGITLVAGTQISNSSFGTAISSASNSGSAGNITMVAGASFTEDVGFITITGNSNLAPSQLDLTNGLSINASSTGGNGDGGDVTLVAFAENTGGHGFVALDGTQTLTTGGNGTGLNGNVTIVAGNNDGNFGIATGNINTGGGVGNATNGVVTLQTAAPTAPHTIAKGNATYGGVFSGGVVTNSSVKTGNVTAPSSNILIKSGKILQINSLDVSVTGTGNAGVIDVELNGTNGLQIGSGGTSFIGAINVKGGTVSGNGGSLTITEHGNQITVIHGTALQQNTPSGQSADISISTAGQLQFQDAPVIISNTGGGVAHVISLQADSFNFAGGNVSIQPSAGSTVSLSANTGSVSIGTGGAEFDITNGTGGVSLVAPTINFNKAVNFGILTVNGTTINQSVGSTVTANSFIVTTDGTADFDNFANHVDSVSVAGSGLVSLDNGANNLSVDVNGSASLIGKTTGSVFFGSSTSTTGDIILTAPDFNVQTTVSANSIAFDSASASLTVTGSSGTLTATGVGEEVTFDTSQNMTLNGSLTFGSDSTLNLNATGKTFTVSSGANIVGQQTLTVNALNDTVLLNGLISGNPLIINTGQKGTIANSTGDVTLTSPVQIFGGDIAVIASGSITFSGPVSFTTTLPGGTSGSVTLIAGFNFLPGTGGQVSDDTTTFTTFTPSTTGGNVSLAGVTIDTSGATAGDVLVVARGGSTNAGTVDLGALNASGTTAGGHITIISSSNVNLASVGCAASLAGTSGSFDVFVANPVAATGPGAPQITNGTLTGNFVIGSGSSGNIIVDGGIDAGNGSVSLNTTGSSNEVRIGNGLDAGSIAIDSGSATINLTGLTQLLAQPDAAGNGGSITLLGDLITFNSANGTPFAIGADGTGTGNGGSITYKTSDIASYYVGGATKPKKGSVFISLSAVSGGGAGADGGSIDLEVGGNLTIDTNFVNASPQGSGASEGAEYEFKAGTNQSSKKGGAIVIVGNLDASGLNLGNGGSIQLDMRSKSAFTVGGTKTPKNGILGQLIALGTSGSVDITNENGGIVVADTAGFLTDSVGLVAGGKGTIGTSNATLTTVDLSLETAAGAIGKKGMDINVSNLTIDGGSSVSIHNFNSAVLDLNNSQSAGSLTLTTDGGLNFRDYTTTSGDITMIAGGGSLAGVGSGNPPDLLANNGSITLQQLDTVSGDIFLGSNGTIKTAGKGGDVTLAIGLIPKKPTNITGAPALLDVQTPGGLVFFNTTGSVVTALNSLSTAIAKNANVIFSSTSSQTITLNGNNVIEADPPAPHSNVVNALLTQPNSITTQGASIPSINNETSIGTSFGSQSVSALPTDLLSTSKSTTPEVSVASLAAASQSAPTGQFYSGITEAYVWCDEELGLESATMLKGSGSNSGSNVAAVNGVEVAKLRKGTILLAPSKNTRLDTPMGSVEVSKDAVALVVLDENRLAVYDLHDLHKGSVRIASGSKSTTLSPGRCTVLTNRAHHGFERVNPMVTVGYKSVGSQDHGNGIKAFNAEFSTVHAIGSVKPLRALFNSKHDAAKRMTTRMMKTSAVLMQLGSSEEFKFYAEPSITAMNR